MVRASSLSPCGAWMLLQAAAIFAAGKAVAGIDIKSTDVLKIANAWLAWATADNEEA